MQYKANQFQQLLEDTLNSRGQVALPNVKEVEDPHAALDILARCSKMATTPYELRLQNFDPPRNGTQTHEKVWYPKVFLNVGGMGGSFNGTGAILVSGYPKARVFTFSMCEHEWDESGANHSRGWHPKRCKKCGFDASIDSGD